MINKQLERITKKTWEYDFYYNFFHTKENYSPEIRAAKEDELKAIKETLDFIEFKAGLTK